MKVGQVWAVRDPGWAEGIVYRVVEAASDGGLVDELAPAGAGRRYAYGAGASCGVLVQDVEQVEPWPPDVVYVPHLPKAGRDPRDRITARLAELEKVHASYLHYQEWRVKERDHHGAWDAAVNLSETECEMAGLRFALEVLEGT